MNYNTESKIWRVGGPLFVYLGITYGVQLLYYLWIFYVQFNTWDINAAFNGLVYVESINMSQQRHAVEMSGVAMIITIPILLYLMKKDYEYPVNSRIKEESFVWNRYIQGFDYKAIPAFALLGIVAAMGVSRIMLMLPVDGILGDYGAVQDAYHMSSVWMQLIVLGVLSPVVEELLFRGLVYKRLKIYYEASIAAYISAIIFGVAHFNLVQGLYAFVMGIFFAFIHEKYKSVFAPMIVHMAANIAIVISGVNPISQFIDRYWFIRLLVGLIFTAVFAVVIIYLYKRSDKNEK